jgi:hypothetical protein
MTQISLQSISERIDDWVSRLNRLYDTLDDWLASIPHDRVKRGTLLQAIEPFMRQVNIAPRELPTYTILQGKKRIAFVPSALWVAGANGRVNVTTNVKQHILVDRGDSEQGSKWQLVVDDFKRLLVPFNRSQLLRLVAEEEWGRSSRSMPRLRNLRRSA